MWRYQIRLDDKTRRINGSDNLFPIHHVCLPLTCYGYPSKGLEQGDQKSYSQKVHKIPSYPKYYLMAILLLFYGTILL